MNYNQAGNAAVYHSVNEAVQKQAALGQSSFMANQTCNTAPQPCSDLDGVCNRFVQVIDIARAQATQLERICEKLYGPRPCCESNGKDTPNPCGTIGTMHAGLDMAISRMLENGELIQRISGAV